MFHRTLMLQDIDRYYIFIMHVCIHTHTQHERSLITLKLGNTGLNRVSDFLSWDFSECLIYYYGSLRGSMGTTSLRRTYLLDSLTKHSAQYTLGNFFSIWYITYFMSFSWIPFLTSEKNCFSYSELLVNSLFFKNFSQVRKSTYCISKTFSTPGFAQY